MDFNFFNKSKSKESTGFIDFGSEFASTLNNKFAKDIFTQTKRDTHEEFRQSKKAFFSNSMINAATTTMVDLIKGDGFYIESTNSMLSKYLESFANNSGLIESYNTALLDYAITGNGYIEVVRDKEGIPVKFFPYSNSEDIYIDYDFQTNTIKRYIQRTLVGEQSSNDAKRVNTNQKTQSYSILTPQGRQTVVGIEIPKENLIHIKRGINLFGVYGRGEIASTLDDLRILESIERSVAVISRYKAIPKKILTKIVDPNKHERPLNEEEINKLGRAMRNSSDDENFILNGTWDIKDLSDGGKDINLEGYIDYFKRKITIAIAPEFIIHSENANRATSKEQKQVYFLRISSMRTPVEEILSKVLTPIANKIAREKPQFAGTFLFKNGEYDVLLPEEKEQIVLSRWASGLITLAEARNELDLPELEGTDVFTWETTQAQDTSFPSLPAEKLNLSENVTKKKSSGKSSSKKSK